jgi:heterodisulfide reductase subunit C
VSKPIQNLKQQILDNCIACGTCAKICPSIEVAQMGQIKPKVIQEHLLDFIKAPQADDMVSKRIDSCLECFRCVDVCPKDLNPLAFIGLAKFMAFQNGHERYVSAKPGDYRAHYQSLNNDLNEGRRSAVTKKTVPNTSRHVNYGLPLLPMFSGLDCTAWSPHNLAGIQT